MNCALCLNPNSNHTTEQHEQAQEEQRICVSCGTRVDHDDDEVSKCRECLDEYWTWRREMYYDNLAKEEGGEG